MNKSVQNWIQSADYDLQTAYHMFSSERYIYTIFMCHLTIEKILKAKIEEKTGQPPPKIHDLDRLLLLSELKLDKEKEIFIVELSNLSVAIRYPEDFNALYKSFTKERTQNILMKTNEVFLWIRNSLTI